METRDQLLERAAQAMRRKLEQPEQDDPVLVMVHQQGSTLADLYRKARRAGLAGPSHGYH